MSLTNHNSIGSFTRKSTFFWASVGATVGLANLWQFPYLASMHGGGYFVLLYLACLLIITLPLMITESVFGRYSRQGIVPTMNALVKTAGVRQFWRLAGPLSILAAFLVLSFTAVFGSIALAYIFLGARDVFEGATVDSASAVFSDLVANPDNYRIFMAWHGAFLLLVFLVSARGVVLGLERSVRMIVPLALVLMTVLFFMSASHGRLDTGIRHILELRPDQLGMDSIQGAFFHAFYTLGLGMGVWTVFGAYSTSHTRLKRSILAVVLIDTLVSIGAGLMVFSIAGDGSGLDGERGFSLLFVSLPAHLAALPYSQVMIAAVFLAVVLIVWASAISLFEPVVGWLMEWSGASRVVAVALVGLAVWLVGVASLLSFNVWADVRPGGASPFRWIELVAGGLVIPAVGVLVSAFAGWCLSRRFGGLLLGHTPTLFRKVWYWVLRLVLPFVIAWIGLQYTVFSVTSFCNGQNTAGWCGNDQAAEAPMSKASPKASPANETDEAVEPTKAGLSSRVREDESLENAPKEGNILYDSV